MRSVVDQLLQCPTLPDIVDQLQARLADERARRERFYQDIPPEQKAEFINGEVMIHSPAAVKHLEVRERLSRLLSSYVDRNLFGRVMGEKALCVFPRNDYEPDVCFFSREKASLFEPDQHKLPPPDFIAEVLSDSTEARDRGEKFQDYAAHGVREYWIVDPTTEVLEQYVVHEDGYRLVMKSGSGEVRGVVIPGFCVPVRALFDAGVNIETLTKLLSEPLT